MKDPAIRSDRFQCLMAMFSLSVVSLCVSIGVIMNLVTLYDENFDHMGIRTFCMFTVNSNILSGLTMLIALSYTIDGLRTGNYHMPEWIVDLMLAAVTGVTLTFLVSLFVLSPVKGFVLIFTGSRFFLHGVCPVLAIIAFGFFVSDHRIKIRESFFALIPVFIYTVVYVVMVVVIGESNGGWEDFYGFATRVPLWVSLVLIMPLTYGIATLLRLLHNWSYWHRKRREAEFYRREYHGENLRLLVTDMAKSRRKELRMKDIVIPVHVIEIMKEHSASDMTLEQACCLYLETYLESEENDIHQQEQSGKGAET